MTHGTRSSILPAPFQFKKFQGSYKLFLVVREVGSIIGYPIRTTWGLTKKKKEEEEGCIVLGHTCYSYGNQCVMTKSL